MEVLFGAVVVARELGSLGRDLSAWQIAIFVCAVIVSVAILYFLTMSLASLMFWKADFLFTWLLRPVVQLARFPAALYSGWLKLLLTWVVPVTVPHDGAGSGPAGRDLAANAVHCRRPRVRRLGRDEPAVPSGAPALRERIELNPC